MSDDDFNLDELINAHSARVIEKNDDEEGLEDFEEAISSEKAEDLLGYDLSDELDLPSQIDLEENDNIMTLDSLTENKIEYDDSKISTISDYSRYILKEIENKNLPTTPENYQIYFIELLKSQDERLQESIYKILDKEGLDISIKKSKELEQSIDKSVKLTQQLLNLTSKVHGNIHIMRNIVYKRDNELTNRNSSEVVKLLKFDLSKLENVLNKQSNSMKNIYSRSVEAANAIHEKSIFDTKFDIYNRRYFLDSLKDEIQKMEYFNYKSSVALIIPDKTLTSQHLTPRVAFIISKTISKILLDNFKRNDVVSYYGNNIFGIIVTRSDIDESEEKIIELIKSLKKSSLFVAGKEVNLKVKIGITELIPHIKTESSLLKSLDALKIANKSNKSYHILL